MKLVGWAIALLGVWDAADIVALLVPGFGPIHASVWSHIGAGLVLIVAGSSTVVAKSASAARKMLWAALAGGGWLIVGSFELGNPLNVVGLWNDILVGVIVLIISAAALLRSRETE